MASLVARRGVPRAFPTAARALSAAVTSCDVCVIGGGGLGVWAAIAAAEAGAKVVLLEQFAPAHDRGSSHGDGRIYRFACVSRYFTVNSKGLRIAALTARWHTRAQSAFSANNAEPRAHLSL
jgi:glycine/D-amino acid oxidase-like deaminating enzyme